MSLQVEGIDTFYGTSHILHGISLSVEDGGMVSILGRNGAGKTTLLRSIIGTTPPRGGSIRFNDVDITTLKPHQRAQLGISYVPQGRDIFDDVTVMENLLLSVVAKGRDRRKGSNGAKVPDIVFDYFPALKSLTRRKGGVLSGGQQQQLAIARALVQEPNLLLLDEPTEGLQPSVVEEIAEIIKRIHLEQQCAILLVEQNLPFVKDMTREFAILENGVIAIQGEIEVLTDDLIRQHLSV